MIKWTRKEAGTVIKNDYFWLNLNNVKDLFGFFDQFVTLNLTKLSYGAPVDDEWKFIWFWEGNGCSTIIIRTHMFDYIIQIENIRNSKSIFNLSKVVWLDAAELGVFIWIIIAPMQSKIQNFYNVSLHYFKHFCIFFSGYSWKDDFEYRYYWRNWRAELLETMVKSRQNRQQKNTKYRNGPFVL